MIEVYQTNLSCDSCFLEAKRKGVEVYMIKVTYNGSGTSHKLCKSCYEELKQKMTERT